MKSNNGWLVVERQRAPRCKPQKFRGSLTLDRRPPPQGNLQLGNLPVGFAWLAKHENEYRLPVQVKRLAVEQASEFPK